VIYIKTLKTNLNKYIKRQRRNHFLHRLRRNLRKKINNVAQILKIRSAFVALTQRIKSALFFRFDIKNKILNRKSFLKSRNNFKESSYNRRSKKTTLTTKIRDVLTTKNC